MHGPHERPPFAYMLWQKYSLMISEKRMETKTMLKIIAKLLAFGLSIFFLIGCIGDKHTGDKPVDVFKLKAKPYAQFTLLKEWPLKAIDPKLPLAIVSMTATNSGVYVLVKNSETKTAHRKLSELQAEEKEKEIEKMKWSFGRVLTEEEYINEPGYGLKIIQIESYWIQHYTDEGAFVRQWNGQEAHQRFVKATKIASDEAGNIFVADYGSNKIKKFSPEGKFVTYWKIQKDAEIDKEPFIYEQGLAVYKNMYVYAVVGHNGQITKYDTNGSLLGMLKINKEFWTKRDENEQLEYVNDKIFQHGKDESIKINDIMVNEKGELFLLDRKLNMVCKIDEGGSIKRWYLTVLNEGFEPELDPKLWKELRKVGMKRFNTSSIDAHFPFYRLGYISCKGELIFVTLIGYKNFGVLDSIVLNSSKGDLNYFKQKRRTTLKEFEKEVVQFDLNVALTSHDNYMYLGRTIEAVKRVNQETYSFIQKYEIKEK